MTTGCFGYIVLGGGPINFDSKLIEILCNLFKLKQSGEGGIRTPGTRFASATA